MSVEIVFITLFLLVIAGVIAAFDPQRMVFGPNYKRPQQSASS
ncbi:MAG: hypothetical protein AAF661_15735 [Pseudomonadota bacterium]